MTDGDEIRARLRAGLDRFDDAEVARVVGEFVADLRGGAVIDPEVGLGVLRLLRRKRKGPLMQQVAEALIVHGADSVAIRHHYALGLLDDDRTVAAEALLTSGLPPEAADDPEVLGALGRVHKQRYVGADHAPAAQRAAELAGAVTAYEQAYRQDPVANYYQGINAAALLARAAADGITVPGRADGIGAAEQMATAILAAIADQDRPSMWQCATAAEACLVLGDTEQALTWTARYVASDADAFEYASTLRQFERLWRLDSATMPGLALLPLLRNRLLLSQGGSFSVRPDEFNPASLRGLDAVQDALAQRGNVQYERVFGWDRFQTMGWLRTALESCRSVALIESAGGDGIGTGFVLAGAAIRPEWPERVLLTNAHVVPDGIAAREAFVSFHGVLDAHPGDGPGDRAGVRVPVDEDPLWASPKDEYDACFLPLPESLSTAIGALPLRPAFPALGADHQVRAYVIGHPGGNPSLRVSLHDSLVVGVDERYAHYRSPTEAGSSGSPVFDDAWRVIALHHGWNDDRHSERPASANEGIRLDRLVDAVRAG